MSAKNKPSFKRGFRKLQEEEHKRETEEVSGRLKEQQPVIAKPIIREPIIKEPIMSSAAVVTQVVATTGAARIKTEPDWFSEDSESEIGRSRQRNNIGTHRQRASAMFARSHSKTGTGALKSIAPF